MERPLESGQLARHRPPTTNTKMSSTALPPPVPGQKARRLGLRDAEMLAEKGGHYIETARYRKETGSNGDREVYTYATGWWLFNGTEFRFTGIPGLYLPVHKSIRRVSEEAREHVTSVNQEFFELQEGLYCLKITMMIPEGRDFGYGHEVPSGEVVYIHRIASKAHRGLLAKAREVVIEV